MESMNNQFSLTDEKIQALKSEKLPKDKSKNKQQKKIDT